MDKDILVILLFKNPFLFFLVCREERGKKKKKKKKEKKKVSSQNFDAKSWVQGPPVLLQGSPNN